MSSDLEYIVYICEQLNGVGALRYRKMFDEYMLYVNEKPLVLVCDNTAFIKINEITTALMQTAEQGLPYPGARPHYILDIDNGEKACALIKTLEAHTPLPKPKKKK